MRAFVFFMAGLSGCGGGFYALRPIEAIPQPALQAQVSPIADYVEVKLFLGNEDIVNTKKFRDTRSDDLTLLEYALRVQHNESEDFRQISIYSYDLTDDDSSSMRSSGGRLLTEVGRFPANEKNALRFTLYTQALEEEGYKKLTDTLDTLQATVPLTGPAATFVSEIRTKAITKLAPGTFNVSQILPSAGTLLVGGVDYRVVLVVPTDNEGDYGAFKDEPERSNIGICRTAVHGEPFLCLNGDTKQRYRTLPYFIAEYRGYGRPSHSSLIDTSAACAAVTAEAIDREATWLSEASSLDSLTDTDRTEEHALVGLARVFLKLKSADGAVHDADGALDPKMRRARFVSHYVEWSREYARRFEQRSTVGERSSLAAKELNTCAHSLAKSTLGDAYFRVVNSFVRSALEGTSNNAVTISLCKQLKEVLGVDLEKVADAEVLALRGMLDATRTAAELQFIEEVVELATADKGSCSRVQAKADEASRIGCMSCQTAAQDQIKSLSDRHICSLEKKK